MSHGAILPRYTPGVPPSPAGRLLEWFRSSARELPWRTPFPRDPYAVLVSEVMAQQTRLERVVPTFVRFVKRFPSVHALAAANHEDVLHAFSGLGYYRRARLLHDAARSISERGAWPTTAAELRALPGFGPYTAAAVAALAFGGDEPPVDGNIARVAARLHAVPLALGSGPLLKEARLAAAALYADVPTPQVWEGLMELGATVCTPTSPRCDSCPLAPDCAGRAAGTPSAFPLPRVKRAREGQRWAAVWLERRDGCVLLRRVDHGPLLVGLWLPPFSVVAGRSAAGDAARTLARDAGLDVPLTRAATVKHGITHRDIDVLPFVGAVRRMRVAEVRDGWSWQNPRAPRVPTSSLLAKLADACSPPAGIEPTIESET